MPSLYFFWQFDFEKLNSSSSMLLVLWVLWMELVGDDLIHLSVNSTTFFGVLAYTLSYAVTTDLSVEQVFMSLFLFLFITVTSILLSWFKNEIVLGQADPYAISVLALFIEFSDVGFWIFIFSILAIVHLYLQKLYQNVNRAAFIPFIFSSWMLFF